jgi:small multidrug resistance pump
MTMFHAALVGAILLGVTGQFLLKMGAAAEGLVQQLLAPPSIAGLGCYFLSAMLYMLALRQIPLSVAYPSVSASYVVVALFSMLIFGEALGPMKLAGIALISVGVVLLYA